MAVGVIVELDGKIVLGRRAHEPKLGLWSFPSGYVDAGEVVEAAAVREVEEEVGLRSARPADRRVLARVEAAGSSSSLSAAA